jgi:hypothetical protein
VHASLDQSGVGELLQGESERARADYERFAEVREPSLSGELEQDRDRPLLQPAVLEAEPL